MLLGSASCADETETEPSAPREGASPMPELTSPEGLDAQRPTLVYEAIRVVSEDGEEVDGSEVGTVDTAILQRAARPWSYFDEPVLYHEQAWSEPREDGSVEHGYRLFSTPNPTRVVFSPRVGPPEVEPDLLPLLDRVSPNETVRVIMNLKYLPPWDVPPRPSQTQSTDDLLAVATAREEALAARGARVDELAAPVVEEIEATGGVVIAIGRRAGWIEAEIGADTLEALAKREDLVNVSRQEGKPEFFWQLGDGRTDARTGVDRFHAQGHDGEIPNPTRHAYNDITIAIADSRPEDEACSFYETSCSGTSRIEERLDCCDADSTDCTATSCTVVTNFADSDGDIGHGTAVASVILGSYTDGEGDDYQLGDSAWTAGAHSATWEDAGTGMAPEARVIFMDVGGHPVSTSFATNAALAESFDKAADYNVDIYNGSWSNGGANCNPYSSGAVEQALDLAFEDGVFVVMAAGNNTMPGGGCGAPDWTQCSIANPADTFRAFAVNAYDSSASACSADYDDCRIHQCYYRLGGMQASSGGYTRTGISGIGLVAPTLVTNVTNNKGARGEVSSSGFSGTSAAAPHIAGMAATIKAQYLDLGHTWVNNPGHLNALMLGMGDRASPVGSFITHRVAGSDDLYGQGRVRMRLLGAGGGLGAWGRASYSLSFTPSSPTWTTTLWSTDIPASTQTVKCVLYQPERYGPSFPSISNLDLRMRVFSPGSGESCATLGQQHVVRTDSSYDNVSMVRLGPSELTSGRCIQVQVIPQDVTSYGINAKLYCQYTGVSDHDPPN